MNTTFFTKLWLLPLILLTSLASHAQQYDPNQVYDISNGWSRYRMEIGYDDKNAVGHGVTLTDQPWSYFQPRAHQEWVINDIGGGLFKITNRNSGQVLSIGGSYPYALHVQPQQTPWSGSDGQKWRILPGRAGAGYVKIVNYRSGLALVHEPGTQGTDPNVRPPYQLLQDFDFNELANQWRIELVSSNFSNQLKYATFTIQNMQTGRVMGATANDNGVSQVSTPNLAGAQWLISDYINGWCVIKNRNTGEALEMGNSGGWGDLGHTANTSVYTGGTNQQWALMDINDSHLLTANELANSYRPFKIMNRYSGKVLQVAGSGSDFSRERQPINQWESLGHPWQQWYLVYVSDNVVAPTTQLESATSGTTDNVITPTTQLESATSGIISSSLNGVAPAPASTTIPVEGINLYPNPAHDELVVALASAREVKAVTITDVRGTVTAARYLGEGKIKVSELTPGFYMLTVSDGKQEYHQKFVKD